MSQVDALVCLMARFLMIFAELMWLVPFWQRAWTRSRVKWVEISLNFEPFKQLAYGYVEFTELPSRPRIGNRWCLRIYNIDYFLIGGVGFRFLWRVAFLILSIARRCLWYMGNKFFTTIWICFFSLGLFVIWAAFDLHLVIMVEKDSLGFCLVVSKSCLVMSTSILYLYCL